MAKKGLVYLFEGGGKGKTSAALGVAVRALMNNWKVVWVAFIKEESWNVSEKKLRDKFENLEMYFVGKGFYISNQGSGIRDQDKKKLKIVRVNGGVVVDKASEDEHKRAAKDGLKLVEEKLVSGNYQLVVLDEVVNAISEGLLIENEVLEVLSLRGKAHVVLTGRGASEKLEAVADLVTECRKVKHPYDLGVTAVKGLDY